MKICPTCGHNNADNAGFCSACGNSIPAQTNNANSQNVNTAPNNATFISNDEYEVARLANDAVTNVIAGEGFKSESAILTNKRLYYTHKTGIINLHSQEEIVDVKDITGTKIANFNPRIFFLLAGLAMLIFFFISISEDDFSAFLAGIGIALFFLGVYAFAKKSHLRIEYAGGHIYFSVKKYGKASIRNFQNAIHRVKDSIDSK